MLRSVAKTSSQGLSWMSMRAFSTINEPSKNPLKIVRFVIPEFTPEIAKQLKKPVLSPLDTLPEGIDRDVVAKYPVLLKVFNKEILPQDLPTYNERMAYYLATYKKGKASGRRKLKTAKRMDFAKRVHGVVAQKYKDEAPIRESIARQQSTRAVRRRFKGIRARFPAPVV